MSDSYTIAPLYFDGMPRLSTAHGIGVEYQISRHLTREAYYLLMEEKHGPSLYGPFVLMTEAEKYANDHHIVRMEDFLEKVE